MTSDNKKFTREWFEVDKLNIGFKLTNINEASNSKFKWFPYNKGGALKKWYGNNELVVNWQAGGRDIIDNGMTSFRCKNFYFKEGLTWSFVASVNNFGVRYKEEGFIFDIGGSSSFPTKEKLQYINGYLNSKLSYFFLSLLNPTLNFQGGNINSLPFKYEVQFNNEINNISLLSIKLSKNDWNSRETSWDFEQSPLLNESTSLKEAYQKWQDVVTNDFFQLHENEEELNRIFIEIYGLQEELTPEVALKDITILQEELNGKELEQLEAVFRAKGADAVQLPIKKDEVISQFLSYSIGVFMGRYRLDKPGLHIASKSYRTRAQRLWHSNARRKLINNS